MQGYSIDKIVSTYNLPLRIRSLVLRVAHRNVERLGLTSFDDQYRYIGDLVERFELPYEDKRTVRLDSPVFNDGRTWRDILPGRNLYEEEDEGLTLCEAVGTSHSFLSERQKEIQLRLLSNSNANGTTYLNVDEVVADFLGIKWRSEEVRRLLEEDTRFMHPERRIIYVNLKPENLQIQWGRRHYSRNPLAYFKRHLDVYGRFVEQGRKALSLFDCGLYISLNEHEIEIGSGKKVRQIELAIPKKKPHCRSYDTNESTLKRITDAYELFNESASETARHLCYDRSTIIKYWRKAGLKIQRGGRCLQKREREKIVASYLNYDGNASRASKVLPYHIKTILRYWRKENLPIRRRGMPSE